MICFFKLKSELGHEIGPILWGMSSKYVVHAQIGLKLGSLYEDHGQVHDTMPWFLRPQFKPLSWITAISTARFSKYLTGIVTTILFQPTATAKTCRQVSE